MTTAGPETPIRRLNVSRMLRTPQSAVSEANNDDEEERRQRRSASSLDDTLIGTGTTVETNENIKKCLQMYSDNKLSKENAWSVSIIDTFSRLLSKHSSGLQNFQVAGSTLEASTKVYGLRVDSVHSDVMRMSAELSRQTAKMMSGETEDDLDESVGNERGNKENEGGGEVLPQAKAKKKRVRKMASTITKSKDSINATLDTIPFTDPFFAKLNSVVGDVNSSSRLMQNIIPTKMAELQLHMGDPFWDASPMEVDVDVADDYSDAEILTINFPWMEDTDVLHTLLSGYVITDAPAEDDEDEAEENRLQNEEDVQIREQEPLLLNRSALDVHFDINAEVEPVPVGDAYIMDYDANDIGIDQDDDFAEDDQIALNNCRGLRRKTVIIQDMRPLDASSINLEYSYRPLDNISQYWAGPSHWKFKRQTRQAGASLLTDGGTSKTAATKERTNRKKARFEPDELDDVLSVNDEAFLVYNPNRPIKNTTHLKSSICRKWESKKLKLPTDLHLDRNRFDMYQLAKGLKVRSFDAAPEPDVPEQGYDYENPEDKSYCSRIMQNDETDNETEQDVVFPSDSPDDHHQFEDVAQSNEVPDPNASLDVIPTEFQGAPDKVAKINIAYAKTAKVVDMKQLKYCCWRLITEHTATADAATPASPGKPPKMVNFTTLYRELPRILSKTMSENISKSLAFYSVLHLSNERSLVLQGQQNLEDFYIKPQQDL